MPSYLHHSRLSWTIILSLFLTLWTFRGEAQKIKFKRFSLDQGLSMNDIRAITQDSKGFVWIGTLDGLNKFDGYQFQVYKNNPQEKTSLSNNTIWALLEDGEGLLYIGTDNGGLNIYDQEKDSFSSFKHDPKDAESIGANEVSALFEDSNGTVWVGTDGGGLNIFNKETKKFSHYKHDPQDPNSIISNVVRTIAEDQNGQLWIGTDQGISVLDKERKIFRHYQHAPNNPKSLGSNSILKIFVDSNNNKWIGTTFGLYVFNEQKKSFTSYLQNPFSNSIVGNYVPDISETPDGKIWIATNFGISVLDQKTQNFSSYQNDPLDQYSLIDNGLNTFYWDRMGNLWVGSYVGLCIKEAGDTKFTHYSHNPNNENSLKNKEAICFYEDKKGKVWIGVRGGFDQFDRSQDQFTHYQPSMGEEMIQDITSFHEDDEGNFWLGSPTGLYLFNQKSGSVKKIQEGHIGETEAAPLQEVWYIKEDSKKNLWLCSFNRGVYFLDKKENKVYPLRWENKYLPHKDVFSFYIDKEDNLWIGTAQEGLFKINKEKNTYSVYTKNDEQTGSIGSNFILTTFEDQQGNFWVGTREGLNLMDRKTDTFITYTENDGLPNGVINSILEDNKGNLWLGTVKGISKFNPKNKSFKNYTVDDGLQHTDFWHRSALKLGSGELMFGGMNGFNLFHPDSLKENTFIPPVYLTGFQIFNKPVEIGEANSPLSRHISQTNEITLSYEQSVFSFDFVGLNYIISKNNQYAYKLDGFDKDWSYVGSQRKATYTNLSPGNYTFRVKASNNDGHWNEKGTALAITITPPYWETWWFRIILTLAVLGGAVGFYWVRINAVKAQKAELEKQVKEKTADIQKANEDLTKRQEEILQQQEELQAQAELLLETNDDLRNTKEEIALQRDHFRIVNEQMVSSIQYAQTIQMAILPSQEKIREVFPEHFIIYRAKDVVSGDFYWFSHLAKEDSGLETDLSFLAVVDCTGHGVPGAFMSIIGSTLLNEIINQKQIIDPAQILEQLDLGVKVAVAKAKGINTAGMDVCLCRIEKKEGKANILFCGAKRNLLYVKAGSKKVQKLAADRRSIGSNSTTAFTTTELELESGSMLYLTSDGYADQNNVAREKLGGSRVNELIGEVTSLPAEDQKQQLEAILDQHQKGTEQRDDISFVGLRI